MGRSENRTKDNSGKGSRVFRAKPSEIEAEQRFAYIEKCVERYEVKFMCEMLVVSRSGYYKYVKSKEKPDKNAAILAAMKEILEEDPENENYGKVRMHEALRARGIKCSQGRVSAIMEENGLRVSKKRKPKGITKADKERGHNRAD